MSFKFQKNRENQYAFREFLTTMDELPQPLLLQILSRLDDSADVARCRVASKAFNAVFPGLRSINLKWYNWASSINRRIRPSFMTVFVDLISKLEIVESIHIDIAGKTSLDDGSHRLNEDFVVDWLSRVSGSLKSLSIYDHDFLFPRNLLLLISQSCCHNLVNLELKYVSLSVDNLNPMPMLTSLTLEHLYMEDEHLNELHKCFPNLQVLKLSAVGGLQHPKIHFLNLKTCFWQDFLKGLPSLTLITPNLITLTFVCDNPPPVYIEAPMLSHFHLDAYSNADTFMVEKFENLKTIWLRAFHVGVLLSIFPIIETVETLTLDSEVHPHRQYRDSEFTLGKVFAVFPNVTSMRIKLGAWLELEAWLDRKSCRRRKKPKTTCQFRREGLKLNNICADLKLVDPSLTFSAVACVLDQCVGVSNFSLIINSDVTSPVFESFRSKCMARWPGLEWRWGIRTNYKKVSWITEGSLV